ncbi:hypothetical protein D9V86_12730, partial [Bacteroidetes/Chlorobi group bacterium ChocPot_Mid]
DFSIINISLDSDLSSWVSSIQKYPYGHHFISIGSDGNQYSKDYFINGVPRCFLIDKKGKVIYNTAGFHKSEIDTLEKYIKKQLKIK